MQYQVTLHIQLQDGVLQWPRAKLRVKEYFLSTEPMVAINIFLHTCWLAAYFSLQALEILPHEILRYAVPSYF